MLQEESLTVAGRLGNASLATSMMIFLGWEGDTVAESSAD